MVYTDEIRKKLDAILKAFEEYIDGQSYFDIVYSKKIGYVWILTDYPSDAGAVVLDTPAKMLDRLFNEIINDVVNDAEIRHTFPMRLHCPSGKKTKPAAGLLRCWSRLLRTRTVTCNLWTDT